MEEGTSKLGADLVSLLLLLLQKVFELVCGETHSGVWCFVQGAMVPQPWVLKTLGCSGPPPIKSDMIILSFLAIYRLVCSSIQIYIENERELKYSVDILYLFSGVVPTL